MDDFKIMKSSVLLFALALGTAATSWATVTSCAGQSSATLPSAGDNGNTPVNGCGQIDSGFNNLTTPGGPDGNNFTTPTSAIFVVNSSFETLPVSGLTNACGVGCSYSTGAIPGWSGSNSFSGQFQPGTPGNVTWFSTLSSDGSPTVAYSNGGATLSQTMVPTVQVDDTYTLMVDLGRRNDLPFMASVGLLINGVLIPASGTAPTPGDWSTYTATYTGLAADVGQSITIELFSSGPQGDFDNVRLDETVPEPAGITLLGLGLVGLSVFARRKRAS
jgi:PEP-CTERM motif